MSSSPDRIPVPTNGHRAPLPAETPSATPEPGPSSGPSVADPRVAFTPGQVAAGFGIIAALILLVARKRRGKRA